MEKQQILLKNAKIRKIEKQKLKQFYKNCHVMKLKALSEIKLTNFKILEKSLSFLVFKFVLTKHIAQK